MRRKVKAVSKFLFILSMIVMVSLEGVVFYNVILRYIFRKPTFWSTEVTSLMLVILTFLAIAEIAREDRHIKFSLIIDRLSPKNRSIIKLINSLFGILFAIFLAWEGGKATLMVYSKNMHTPSLLGTPLYVFYIFLPIGAISLGAQLIVNIIDELEKIKEGSKT